VGGYWEDRSHLFVNAYEKLLLARSSFSHHHQNVAKSFEDALKNLDLISTHYIAMFGNLSQLHLVFIGRSKVGTNDTEFGGL